MSVATQQYSEDDTLPLSAPCCKVCGVVVNVLFDIEVAPEEWVHDNRACYAPYIQRTRKELDDYKRRAQKLVERVTMGMG